MVKIRKTEDELEEIVMGEIRKAQECYGVRSAVIIQPVQQNLSDPNWGAGFTCDGAPGTPPRAWEIMRELQYRFELSF
jgi:hypothetical protein